MSEATAFKSFVSETELDEKRQKRQEEWDKVRTAEQPEGKLYWDRKYSPPPPGFALCCVQAS